jgi:hypothetical protein
VHRAAEAAAAGTARGPRRGPGIPRAAPRGDAAGSPPRLAGFKSARAAAESLRGAREIAAFIEPLPAFLALEPNARNTRRNRVRTIAEFPECSSQHLRNSWLSDSE